MGSSSSQTPDHFGEDAEFDNKVPRREMPEQHAVGLGIVVGAFDKYTRQQACRELGGGILPHAGGTRVQGDGIGLHVAEDEDFFTRVLVPEEVRGAVVGFLFGQLREGLAAG